MATTNGEKAAIIISSLVVAGLIGWAIYEGTSDAVGTGKKSGKKPGETGSSSMDSASTDDNVPVITNNPDGSQVLTYPNGKIEKFTKEQVIARAKQVVKGRGADGSWNS